MIKVTVGTATCGNSAGAGRVLAKIKELSDSNKNVVVKESGCIGYCAIEPIVEIYQTVDGKEQRFMYGNVNPKTAELIYNEHIINNKPVEKLLKFSSSDNYKNTNLFGKQSRIVLRNAGTIDPENINDYTDRNGYQGLKNALNMKPEEVIETVLDSGLRGRGGAGFPTGIKWKLAFNQKNDKKYVVCNADEGDPGAFMDRSVLEGDPHAIIEGMAICAYAIGADEGYIYCRAEYPLAIKRLLNAISQAEDKGYLGKNLLDSDFCFTLHVKEGAGAFVCGEETALLASIEGKRGMPKVRPPFPAEKGLWEKPTNINNVETYANVPWILANGASEYKKFGTEKSKGTKVFALTGKIVNSGLIEVEMGTALKDIIFDVGGGILDNKNLKAVQIGGPSGGCIPAELVDTPVDYESLPAKGAIVGSGGMVVLDDSTCMVDVAKYFLSFTQNESCGKCTFCRIGTKRMLEILEKITSGNGEEEDIDRLYDLSSKIQEGSLCGLGQTSPNPILTTLRYFKDEYLEHIRNKKCPAGVCKELISFDIIPDKCIGCQACKKACPTSAISGKLKEVHVLDQDKCIKCGACYKACKFDAVSRK